MDRLGSGFRLREYLTEIRSDPVHGAC